MSPSANATLMYNINSRIGLDTMFSYNFSSGVMDPEVGANYSMPIKRYYSLKNRVAFSLHVF